MTFLLVVILFLAAGEIKTAHYYDSNKEKDSCLYGCACLHCHGLRILRAHQQAPVDCHCSPGWRALMAVNFFYSLESFLYMEYGCRYCGYSFWVRVGEGPLAGYLGTSQEENASAKKGDSQISPQDFSILEPINWCGCDSAQVCRCEEKWRTFAQTWQMTAAYLGEGVREKWDAFTE